MNKSLANFLAFLLTLLGGIGVFGVVSYLVEPASNPSRYQALQIPYWTGMFAAPLMILALIAHRRCFAEMSALERGVFYFAGFLPIAAFCAGMALSG
jgi:hypothetical protein